MRPILLAILLVAACGSDKNDKARANEPTTKPEVKPEVTDQPAAGSGSAVAAGSGAGSAVAQTPEKPASNEGAPPAGGHDFTPEARALLAVGACGGGDIPEGIPQTLVDKHCAVIKKAQDDYTNGWLKK